MMGKNENEHKKQKKNWEAPPKNTHNRWHSEAGWRSRGGCASASIQQSPKKRKDFNCGADDIGKIF